MLTWLSNCYCTGMKNEAFILSYKHPPHFASNQEFSFKKWPFPVKKLYVNDFFNWFFLLFYYFHDLKRLFESDLDLSNEKKVWNYKIDNNFWFINDTRHCHQTSAHQVNFYKSTFCTVLQTSHHFINQNNIFNWELKAQFPV